MLYVFYGDDSFGMREALEELRRRLDADGSLATNTARFDGRTSPVAEVIAACDTVPFLGEARLVVVEGLLAGVRKRGRKAAGEEGGETSGSGALRALLDYLPRMPASTTLVLIEAGSPPVSELARFGEVRQFQLPQKAGVVSWIRERAAKKGVRMEPRAASALAELAGNDPWLLSNELDKLAAYAGDGAVREADVRELVHSTREEAFWALTDAVADGKAAQALKALQALRAQGQADQALLGTVRARLARLAVARSLLDEGAGEAAIGARAGLSGYALTRLLEQAQRWPSGRIREAYRLLVQAEVAVKTGVLDQEVALDLAVHDIAVLRG